MARILILQGHPDAGGGHLCHALADAYAEGARAGGHTVARIDAGALDVPILRRQEDFMNAAAPDCLAEAQAAVMAAEHVVLVFPLWLGTVPAALKIFLEQLLRPGFAFAYTEGGGTRTLLQGRSARIVVTMGMPALAFRLWFLGAGLSVVTRNIFGLVGFAPVRSTVLGSVEAAGEAKRAAWLTRMHALGRDAA